MGLSASQARLLTLTSRLSDLELQAQQISNSKIRLSMQSAQVAEDYADALNKQDLTILSGYDSKGNAQYAALTYDNLTGPNSPLLTQYCLSDNNGNVLVTQAVADAFRKSNSLNGFLENVGAGNTTTYPNGKTAADFQAAKDAVAATQAAYATAQTNTTNALSALDAYGDTYVQGYQGKGNWAYSNAIGNSFTTSYSDSNVLTYMANYGSRFNDQYESRTVGYTSSSSANSVICFYNANGEHLTTDRLNAGASALTSLVSTVTNDATKAVLSILQSQYGSDYSKVQSTLQQAASSAASATQSFYFSQIYSNMQDNGTDSDHNNDTINRAIRTNQIWDDTDGDKELYVDLDQIAKTFLAYFDAACDKANNGSGSDYLSEVNSNSTNRHAEGGTGNASRYSTNFASFNSTEDPDKIIYNATTDTNGKDVASTYQNLLTTYKNAYKAEEIAKTAYDAAVAALNALGTPTITPSAQAGYYTNLYNRMCQGYTTVSNEQNTINSSAWIQAQMQTGNLRLEKCADGKWATTSFGANTDIKSSYDDNAQAIAEAKYNSEMDKIQVKDKKFDLELNNIDTEHSAVQTEVDTVKKVIDKNIERTFKMFDA